MSPNAKTIANTYETVMLGFFESLGARSLDPGRLQPGLPSSEDTRLSEVSRISCRILPTHATGSEASRGPMPQPYNPTETVLQQLLVTNKYKQNNPYFLVALVG